MTKLTVHPTTRLMIDAFIRDPSHALCLTGESGVGLGTLAHECAKTLAGHEYGVTVLSPVKGLISIERVRALYIQTRSASSEKRCFIIDDADAMSPDAQNALLKLLEEPVKNIHFIVTTHALEGLLSTIRSRLQLISVLPVDRAASEKLLDHYQLDDTRKAQSLFLATGKPAELTRLASDDAYFLTRAEVVTQAREFLQADMYGKLVAIKAFTDRGEAIEFLKTCVELLTFSFLVQKHDAAATSLEVFDETLTRLRDNGHVRTQLMHLVTKLS